MKNSIGLILIGLLVLFWHGSADVSHLAKHTENYQNGYLPPQQTQNLLIPHDNNEANLVHSNHQIQHEIHQISGIGNEDRGYLPPYPEKVQHQNNEYQYSGQEEQVQNHVEIHNEKILLGQEQSNGHTKQNINNQQQDRGYLPPYQEQLKSYHDSQEHEPNGVDPNLQVSYYNNQHNNEYHHSQQEERPQTHIETHKEKLNENMFIEQEQSNGHLKQNNLNQQQDRGYLPPYQEQYKIYHNAQEYEPSGVDPNLQVSYHNNYAVTLQSKSVRHEETSKSNPEEEYEDNSQGYNYNHPHHSFEEGHEHNQGVLKIKNLNNEPQSEYNVVPSSEHNNQNKMQLYHLNNESSVRTDSEQNFDYVPPKISNPEYERQETDKHSNVYQTKVNENSDSPPSSYNYQRTEESQQEYERGNLPPINALELPKSSDTLHIIPPSNLGLPTLKSTKQLETNHVDLPLPLPQAGYYIIPGIVNKLPSLTEEKNEHLSSVSNTASGDVHQQSEQKQQQIEQEQNIEPQQYQNQHHNHQQYQQLEIEYQQQHQHQHQHQQQQKLGYQQHHSQYSQQQNQQQPTNEIPRPAKTEIKIIPSVQTAEELSKQGLLTPSQIVSQHFADIELSTPHSNHYEIERNSSPPNDHQFELNQNKIQIAKQQQEEDQSQIIFENQEKDLSRPLEPTHNGNQKNAYLPPVNEDKNQGSYNYNENQVTNLQTYMNSVNPNDRYGSLQFQPQQSIENNSSPVKLSLMVNKQTAIEAYAPGMAYDVSNNVPFSSLTQAGYFPPDVAPTSSDSQNEEDKQNFAQQKSHDNTVFPIADILDNADVEMSQIMQQLQGHIRTIQITNHQENTVRNIKVLDSSNPGGERTIEILGQSNENPMGEHKVLHVISKVPNPQAIHQTIKIFNDGKELARQTNNEYLPPPPSQENLRKLRRI